MRVQARKAAAIGAVALVVGSTAFFTPAAAQADTINAQCGQSVTAKPGDQIQTPFGLQTVTQGLTSLVGGLLGGLCNVTVTIVDTVIAPVPVVGAPLAGGVNGAVSDTTKGLTNTTKEIGEAVSPKPQQQPANQAPPTSPVNQTGPKEQTPANTGGANPAGQGLPSTSDQTSAANLFGFGYWSNGLFSNSFTGYAPMRDYGFLPMALPGVFSPSPGLRYGQSAPGSPLGSDALGQIFGPLTGANTQAEVQNTGHAEALPQPSNNPVKDVGFPVLLAVLALAGVSAVLVRTWVLRRTTH